MKDSLRSLETTGRAGVNLVWLDHVKAIALVWIFVNHIVERVFGYPLIANPFAGWPPLGDRISQLTPLTGHGVWTVPINAARYAGWFGDVGVQLFLIVSGFGLTWGLLRKQGLVPLAVGRFYLRRAARIYPLWWAIHIVFIATWLLVGWGLPVTSLHTYLSFAGIRMTPGLLYYFSPAWWYVGLLVQLYLVYPILWEGLRRLGPGRLLVLCCLVGFSARAEGLLFFEGYLDAWQRGAIFITRLPEFVLGMSAAAALQRDPERTRQLLKSKVTLALAVLALPSGVALSLTLFGMSVAPFLLGAGVLALLWAAFGDQPADAAHTANPMTWLGQHSYSLYLAHHPMILVFLPDGSGDPTRVLAGTTAAALFTLALALGLERSVGVAEVVISRLKTRGVRSLLIWRAAVAGGVMAALLIGAEATVKRLAPQEVFGWGERPSLEPDEVVGWRLKPSRDTRLRWESYEYQVAANSLGFPGPEPAESVTNTFRIFATGDAFTSAEGVDTDQAWPRKLERFLKEQDPGSNFEVLNFGMTGYGPSQYAAVIETFAPRMAPDLILVEMYLNDYQDVLLSDEEFRWSIGFGQPPQDGVAAWVRLAHLRSFVRHRIVEPAKAALRAQPDPRGYFLSGFAALERRPVEEQAAAEQLVGERMTRVAAVASALGAPVVVFLVPAPAEVCGPDDLRHYPSHVSLADEMTFDPQHPRRATERIVQQHGFGYVDLLPVLTASSSVCPYQPGNLHWLGSGHELVARHLASWLSASGYLTREQE